MFQGHRDFINQRLSSVNLLCWFLATSLTTFAGPFSTRAVMSLGPRFLFWSVASGGAIVLHSGLRRLVCIALPNLSVWLKFPLSAGIFAFLFTLILPPLIAVVSGPTSGQFPSVSETFLVSFLLSLGLYVLQQLLVQNSQAAPAGPRLLQRLPCDFSGVILRLTVDDHYVHVVTSEGEYRLLMRFSDAVAELDDLAGSCTHRSHWVAKVAVSLVIRDKGRIFLRTVDGAEIPVSRKYQSDVQAAGLLSGVALA